MIDQHYFSLDVGFKATNEIEFEGQTGLMIEGDATVFDVVDQEGEWTDPDSFSNAARTFFDTTNGPLPILYHHGFDPVLSTKRIGRVIDYHVDAGSARVKAFLPKPTDVTDAIGAKAMEVYEAVRNGLVHSFSLGGVFAKAGRNIRKVGLYEISITPSPVLKQASFVLAKKSLPAVDEALALHTPAAESSHAAAFISALEGLITQTLGGKADSMGAAIEKASSAATALNYGLSRAAHGKALAIAQKDKSVTLHDHLLDPALYPTEMQGSHDTETCPIDVGRRDMYGMKAARVSQTPWGAVDKKSLPDEAYLVPEKHWYPVYEPDGALNRWAVENARHTAESLGDAHVLTLLEPLGKAVGLPDLPAPDHQTAAPAGEGQGGGDKTVAPGAIDPALCVKTLSPTTLPARMFDIASLALDLSDLHKKLEAIETVADDAAPHSTGTSARVPGDGAVSPGTEIGAKAGKKISGLSMQTLRQFATAVIEAGQQLHAWLDNNDPGPQMQDDGRGGQAQVPPKPTVPAANTASPAKPASPPAKKN